MLVPAVARPSRCKPMSDKRSLVVVVEGHPDLRDELGRQHFAAWSLYDAAAGLVSGSDWGAIEEYFAVPGDIYPEADASHRRNRVPCTHARVPGGTYVFVPFPQTGSSAQSIVFMTW